MARSPSPYPGRAGRGGENPAHDRGNLMSHIGALFLHLLDALAVLLELRINLLDELARRGLAGACVSHHPLLNRSRYPRIEGLVRVVVLRANMFALRKKHKSKP